MGQPIEQYRKQIKKEISDCLSKFEYMINNKENRDLLTCEVEKILQKYIGKVFRSHTGVTIKEYMNEKRLREAEQLLIQSTLPVGEIAGKVGFNNVTYFNRLFKAAYGTTPGDYRRARRRRQDKSS